MVEKVFRSFEIIRNFENSNIQPKDLRSFEIVKNAENSNV